jgi:hypothetical protein
MNERIKKMWYMCTMKYYSAIKKEPNYVICRKKWMARELIMLSKMSQTQKDKCHMLSLI